jgi:hypothetical protein
MILAAGGRAWSEEDDGIISMGLFQFISSTGWRLGSVMKAPAIYKSSGPFSYMAVLIKMNS